MKCDLQIRTTDAIIKYALMHISARVRLTFSFLRRFINMFGNFIQIVINKIFFQFIYKSVRKKKNNKKKAKFRTRIFHADEKIFSAKKNLRFKLFFPVRADRY